MPKKLKTNTNLLDLVISKSILIVIVIVLGIFTLIGFATNYVVGIIFSLLLIIAVRLLIDASDIEHWLDENLNKRNW